MQNLLTNICKFAVVRPVFQLLASNLGGRWFVPDLGWVNGAPFDEAATCVPRIKRNTSPGAGGELMKRGYK
eukprot:2545700-Amphidinium_carterae.1